MKPRSGSIKFGDRDLVKMNTHEIIRQGIGVSPEGRHVFPNLTVLDNLELGAYHQSPKAFLAQLSGSVLCSHACGSDKSSRPGR